MTAYLGTHTASVEAALGRAAEILRKSRLPVFGGLGTDMAGVRAALRLAERLGGAADHLASSRFTREMRALHDRGLMYATPREVRNRADLIVLIGPEAANSARIARLLASTPAPVTATPPARRVIELCGGAGSRNLESLGSDPAHIPGLLALLSAAVLGNPLPAGGYAGLSRDAVTGCAEQFKAARFGVAAWSPSDLDELSIQALTGLQDALNATTRFTSLILPDTDNAAGANLLSVWSTGFPLPVGFPKGYPEYEPWRFSAPNLIDSGEADALVWISTLNAYPAKLPDGMPVIALTAPGSTFSRTPEVCMETGRPGVDHNAEFYDEDAAAVTAVKAGAPSAAPSAAALLNRLEVLLEDRLW
jgi:formylmethanofuran dehydrogenase subunit B